MTKKPLQTSSNSKAETHLTIDQNYRGHEKETKLLFSQMQERAITAKPTMTRYTSM